MKKFIILLLVPFYFLACHTPSQLKDAHDGVWSGKATADNYGKWCTGARLNLIITNKKVTGFGEDRDGHRTDISGYVDVKGGLYLKQIIPSIGDVILSGKKVSEKRYEGTWKMIRSDCKGKWYVEK